MNEFFLTNQEYAAKAGGGNFTEGIKIESIDNSSAALALKDGSVAMFTDRGELLIDGSTGGILSDVKNVYFLLGRGINHRPIRSETFARTNETTIEYMTYSPPQKQVSYIGSEEPGAPEGALNLPNPLIPTGNEAEGHTATIRISRTDDQLLLDTNITNQLFSVNIPTNIANATAQEQRTYIITQMISKINAHPNRIVVATAVGVGGSEVGIEFTGYDYRYVFNLSVGGILQYADIVTPEFSATVTEPKYMLRGCGTPIEVAKIERMASVEKGRTDRLTPEEWNTWTDEAKTCMDAGCGYEMLTLKKAELPGGIGEMSKMLQKKPNLKFSVEGTLAGDVPTGAWTISNTSDFKTIMDILLPVVFGAGMYIVATQTEPATDIT